MKKVPIIKLSDDASEGIVKLKQDTRSVYKWSKKRYYRWKKKRKRVKVKK